MTASSSRSSSKRSPGFTLLELLVALSLIATLSSWAYPAYQRHLLQGQLTSIRLALSELLLRESAWRNSQPDYARFAAGHAHVLLEGMVTPPGVVLGARHCQAPTADSPAPAASDCIEVFAQTTATSASWRELSLDSLGQRRCQAEPDLRCWP